jgi:transposase-like protein
VESFPLSEEDSRMPRSKPPYPPEFRARIVELARSGRQLRGLSKEFGVTDTTIRSWLRQADLDEGRRSDGLTSDEKKKLTQLRRENARLREEKAIPKKGGSGLNRSTRRSSAVYPPASRSPASSWGADSAAAQLRSDRAANSPTATYPSGSTVAA